MAPRHARSFTWNLSTKSLVAFGTSKLICSLMLWWQKLPDNFCGCPEWAGTYKAVHHATSWPGALIKARRMTKCQFPTIIRPAIKSKTAGETLLESANDAKSGAWKVSAWAPIGVEAFDNLIASFKSQPPFIGQVVRESCAKSIVGMRRDFGKI